MQKGLIGVLIIGLFIRAGIIGYALQFRENTDILRWKDWAQISYFHSLADTYKPDYLSFGTYPNNMPPGTLYVVSSVYWVWLQIGKVFVWFGIPPGSNDWVNGPLLTLLLRIPSVIADCGIACVLYALANLRTEKRKVTDRVGLLSGTLFFLNPVVLFNSAYMGQMDSINNFFWLVGLVLLLKGRYALASGFVGLSLLIKFSLLFTVPFLLYIVWRQTKQWSLLLLCLGSGVFTTLMFVLPISDSPLSWYVHYFFTHFSGEMQHMTNFAFNVWWVAFAPQIVMGKPDSLFSFSDIRLHASPYVDERFGGIPLGVWAIGVYVLALYPLIRNFVYTKHREFQVVDFFAGLALTSFLFLPKMHDRYMYPALVLLALLAAHKKELRVSFVMLSLLNLLNLFFVWHPSGPTRLYPVINNIWFQWSIASATVITGLFVYNKIILNSVRRFDLR